ncbi:MAG: hypothetical protein ACRDQ2_09965 [Gaiellales bacterium]
MTSDPHVVIRVGMPADLGTTSSIHRPVRFRACRPRHHGSASPTMRCGLTELSYLFASGVRAD